MADQTITINADKPKIKKEDDRFQRYGFAKRIAHLLNVYSAEQSPVIGLYGKWGEGKTSVMNFVKNELSHDYIKIDFNPWLFSDQENLLRAFFKEIARALKLKISKPKEDIGKLLENYGDLLGSIKIAGFGVSGLSSYGKKLKDVTVEDLKERVDAIIRQSGKKIVVFIDDIDRLDVKEIQYIFKLIKLVGDFYNTSYVLSFDDELVAAALAPLYGSEDKSTGYQFLEKIIQVPLVIPKATKTALIKYTMQLVDEVINAVKIISTQDEITRFRTVFDDNFIPAINNPRLANRYANSLLFALPLLYGEVSNTDLMLVEALKVFYPKAHDFMRENPSLFLTDNARERGAYRKDAPDKGTILTQVKKSLETYDEKTREYISAIWKDLFPQYNYITNNYWYADDSWRDWYRAKRLCSGKYFERYFTYAVIEGDISDTFFDQFLTDLNELSLEELKDKMDTLFENTSAGDVIFKIRLWEDRMNVKQSEQLGKLLAEQGATLPVEPGEFSSYTTRAEGAKIIGQLAVNLHKKTRIKILVEILDQSKSLEFSMEVVYWLLYKNEKREEKFLSKEDEKEIANYCLRLFGEQATKDNFFTLLSDGHLWRMLIWWKNYDKETLRKFVKELLGDDAGHAVQFIKIFAPTIQSWGGPEGHQVFKGGLNDKRYESMRALIDVNEIYRVLKEHGQYERFDIDVSRIGDQERFTDAQLANVFMQIYEKNDLTLRDIES